MGGSLEVQADELDRHAAVVDGVAEQTGVAGGAARSVQMDNMAYGLLCQIIPALLNPLSSMVVDVLTSTEEGLHDTADRLRDVSSHYTGTDQSVSSSLDGLR